MRRPETGAAAVRCRRWRCRPPDRPCCAPSAEVRTACVAQPQPDVTGTASTWLTRPPRLPRRTGRGPAPLAGRAAKLWVAGRSPDYVDPLRRPARPDLNRGARANTAANQQRENPNTKAIQSLWCVKHRVSGHEDRFVARSWLPITQTQCVQVCGTAARPCSARRRRHCRSSTTTGEHDVRVI